MTKNGSNKGKHGNTCNMRLVHFKYVVNHKFKQILPDDGIQR